MNERKPIQDLKWEVWKQVPDSDYFVSSMGRAKRTYKTTQDRLLKPYRLNTGGREHKVLLKVHGKAQNFPRLLWTTFYGDIPSGYFVVKKDGTRTNLDIDNLVLMTSEEIGKRFGGRTTTRRLVIDNRTGKVYRGTRAAADALHISRQTVSAYCNGNIKKPMLDLDWCED